MLPHLFHDVQFHHYLLACDRDLATRAQQGGCQFCPGQLHQAHFYRKPRGGPEGLDEDCTRRFSFCCYLCRKRLTPPSLRFLGRGVYFGAVMLLISAMMGDASPRRRHRLRAFCGADARTLGRWRQWWAETFTQTAVWKDLSARLGLSLSSSLAIPRQFLRMAGLHSLAECIHRVLSWLLPLSTYSGGGTLDEHAVVWSLHSRRRCR